MFARLYVMVRCAVLTMCLSGCAPRLRVDRETHEPVWRWQTFEAAGVSLAMPVTSRLRASCYQVCTGSYTSTELACVAAPYVRIAMYPRYTGVANGWAYGGFLEVCRQQVSVEQLDRDGLQKRGGWSSNAIAPHAEVVLNPSGLRYVDMQATSVTTGCVYMLDAHIPVYRWQSVAVAERELSLLLHMIQSVAANGAEHSLFAGCFEVPGLMRQLQSVGLAY